MASVSRVPVMNGCCNRYHPCQILADLLTIREKFQRFEGVVLAYLGALNNVANSLLDGCIKLGMEVVLVTPDQPETAIDPDTLESCPTVGALSPHFRCEEPVSRARRSCIRTPG